MRRDLNKSRLVILPFLVGGLLLVAGYAVVRLVVDVHLNASREVTQELWHIWMPVILAALFAFVVMGRRFRMFKPPKGENGAEKRRDALYWVVILALGGSMLGSQKFITSQSRTLSHVARVSRIERPRANDCFVLSSPPLADISEAGFHIEGRRIPKRYGTDELDLIVYVALPLRDPDWFPLNRIPSTGSRQTRVADPSPCTRWLVKRYTERVTTPGEANVEAARRTLLRRMEYNLTSGDFRRFDHLSVAPHSENSRSMSAAVENSPVAATGDAIILLPEPKPFKKSLTWLWASIGLYLAGALTISLILFSLPAIPERALAEYRARAATPLAARLKSGRLALAIRKGACVATWTLIGLNCVPFIALLFCGVSPISPSARELFEFGGATGAAILGGESWRIFSAMFLHGGLFHLVYNMIALMVVGMAVETVIKPLKYTVIYLASGVGAALLSLLLLDTGTVHVGASGAIFGVMGAMMSLWVRNRKKYSVFPILFFMFGGISLLLGFLPGVNNWAHIGGLITGFALGLSLYVPPKKRRGRPSAISARSHRRS